MGIDCMRNYYRSYTQIGLNINSIPVVPIAKVGPDDYTINTSRPFLPLYAAASDGLIVDPAAQKPAMGPIISTLFDCYQDASNNYVNGVTGANNFVSGDGDAFASYVNKKVTGIPENQNRWNQLYSFLANYWTYAVAADITLEVLIQKLQSLMQTADKQYYLPPGRIIFEGGASTFATEWDAFVVAQAVPDLYLVGVEIDSIG